MLCPEYAQCLGTELSGFREIMGESLTRPPTAVGGRALDYPATAGCGTTVDRYHGWTWMAVSDGAGASVRSSGL